MSLLDDVLKCLGIPDLLESLGVPEQPHDTSNECQAYKKIEDECCITELQCELPAGHDGPHRTHYPGQWGEVRIPMKWDDSDESTAEFHRNVRQ